jgi:ACS family hexuronate transporter-like MFS transporter
MSTPQNVIGKYRWVICGLLFLATTINYIDRQILSLVKPILDKELGWTNEQFGWVNTFFQAAYGLSLPIFGWFIDKYGTKIGYAVSIAAWSVAACGHSLVSTFHGFIMARVSLGLGEGGNFPSAIKAVALWFPKRERAYATALFNSGANVGAIAAPAIVPFVALTWGWQAAFVGAGILGFLWLLLWLPFYNVPEKIKGLKANELDYIRSDVDEQAETKTKVPWRVLLSHKQAWSFVVAKFLTDPVWWFFLIWLPDYFKKTRNLDIKNSWVHLVAIYAVITVLSIVGGWVTGFLAHRGWTVTRARKTGMFVFAVLVVPILAVTAVGDWTAVLLIGLAGAAHQAWSANLFTTVADMFPKKAIASLTGIGGLAGSVGGMIFPVVCGAVIDHYVEVGNATAGYAILFGVCGSAYLIAFGLHHLLAPKFEQIALAGVEAGAGDAPVGH